MSLTSPLSRQGGAEGLPRLPLEFLPLSLGLRYVRARPLTSAGLGLAWEKLLHPLPVLRTGVSTLTYLRCARHTYPHVHSTHTHLYSHPRTCTPMPSPDACVPQICTHRSVHTCSVQHRPMCAHTHCTRAQEHMHTQPFAPVGACLPLCSPGPGTKATALSLAAGLPSPGGVLCGRPPTLSA